MTSIINAIEKVLVACASQAVNSTCWFTIFQDKIPSELDVLKKDGK